MASDSDLEFDASIDMVKITHQEEDAETRNSNNKNVAFSGECTERDEHGHCRNRRMSVAPKFISDAMRMMSRRRSSTDVHHGEVLSISKVKRTGSQLSLIGPLFVLISALLIPAYCVPLIVGGEEELANIIMPIGTSFIVVLPALIFLKWCGHIMKKSFDFGVSVEGDTGRLGYYLPSVPLICLSIAIVFRQANYLVKLELMDAYSEFYMLLLDHGAAMSIFTASVSALDIFHESVVTYSNKIDSIASNNQSAKLKSIMKTFRSFHNEERDKASAIPGGHRSPVKVLSDVVGIYCNIGKVLSITMLILFFLDVDLYSNSVAIGLTVVFAGVITALHLKDALINVISLSISNSIHIGDIVSIGRPGFLPPDNPSMNVTGFFEGVTWGHIIIRDFRRKQVFIRHDEFGKLTLQNWSRRPNKHAHFIIPVVPELSGGADRLAKLAEYAGQWMKEHPDIDQDLYQKSVIKWVKDDGLVLEAVFYPTIGSKTRQIRSEFLVMALDAAKRLNLCLMPAEVRTSSPWSDSREKEEHLEAADFHDLHPSPELTERAGFKPKYS